MKIYSNKFELRTPVERRYYAAPNSIFAFAVKATLDGEDADGTITVFQGSTELTPMEATVDGYKLYQRTSGSETAVNEFDIVYTKDAVVQHFTLIENITDSTVFDIDQQGGVMELPIASDSVLGGIKVGEGLEIEADGKLNVVGSGEETDPVFTEWKNGQEIAAGKDAFATGENTTAVGPYAVASGNDSLAVGFEAAATANGAIQIGMGSNAEINTVKIKDYKVLDGNGNIPEARLGGIPTAVLSGTYSDDTEFSFTVYTKQA